MELLQVGFKNSFVCLLGGFYYFLPDDLFCTFCHSWKHQLCQKPPTPREHLHNPVSKTNKTSCLLEKSELVFLLCLVCSALEHFLHHLLPVLGPGSSQVSTLCSQEPPSPSAWGQFPPLWRGKGGRIALQSNLGLCEAFFLFSLDSCHFKYIFLFSSSMRSSAEKGLFKNLHWKWVCSPSLTLQGSSEDGAGRAPLEQQTATPQKLSGSQSHLKIIKIK